MSGAFVGEIRMFSFDRAPQGWMPCDGRLLNIMEHEVLFAFIGTTYGGDGVSTFGLPDMRGRVPLHQGTGPGFTSRVIGQRAGTETVALTVNQMPAHTHKLVAAGGAATSTSPANALPAAIAAPDTMYIAETADIALNPDTVAVVGAGQAHENRAPILAVNFCICAAGLFPSRN